MFSGEGKAEGESSSSLSSSSDSDSSDNEATAVVPQEHFVQISLLRNPPKSKLGAWEKHTTVLKKHIKTIRSLLKPYTGVLKCQNTVIYLLNGLIYYCYIPPPNTNPNNFNRHYCVYHTNVSELQYFLWFYGIWNSLLSFLKYKGNFHLIFLSAPILWRMIGKFDLPD